METWCRIREEAANSATFGCFPLVPLRTPRGEQYGQFNESYGANESEAARRKWEERYIDRNQSGAFLEALQGERSGDCSGVVLKSVERSYTSSKSWEQRPQKRRNDSRKIAAIQYLAVVHATHPALPCSPTPTHRLNLSWSSAGHSVTSSTSQLDDRTALRQPQQTHLSLWRCGQHRQQFGE